MDVYLVRHAIAEPRDSERWVDDSQRPLSPEGIDLFRVAARGLRRVGVDVEAVIASPYVRAWHTAEILSDEAGWPLPEASPALEPSGPAAACAELLATRSESSLAVVGHQPQLSSLAALFVAGERDGARFELKKGGVICVRFPVAPAVGAGIVRWSVSPKILRLLGR